MNTDEMQSHLLSDFGFPLRFCFAVYDFEKHIVHKMNEKSMEKVTRKKQREKWTKRSKSSVPHCKIDSDGTMESVRQNII